MNRCKLCCCIAFMCMASLGASPIGVYWPFAPGEAQANSPRRQAQKLYQKGVKRIEKKAYQEGLSYFFRALRLIERAEQNATSTSQRKKLRHIRVSFLYVIGRAYQLAQDEIKAYDFYSRAKRANPPARVQKKLNQRLRVLAPKVAATVHIKTNPPGATVTLRRANQVMAAGQTPWQVVVAPGRYAMLIAHPGYRPLQTTIDVQPKSRSFWNYRLETLKQKQARPIPPRRIRSRPIQPRRPIARIPQQVPPPPQGRGKKIAAYTLLGATLLAAGVGVALIIVGQTTFDATYGNPKFKQKPTPPEICQGQTLQGVAIGTFVVAATTGGLAIWLFLSAPPAQKTLSKETHLGPTTREKAETHGQGRPLP